MVKKTVGGDVQTPAHYRLSTETWAMILDEYQRGATATQLCLKWKVSVSALRKRITEHGATKREWGDIQARASAEASEAAARARKEAPPLTPAGEGAGNSAADLCQRALRGVSRAMDQGRLDEAKALGMLAASLGRIPEQPHDRVDWHDFARVVLNPIDALELSMEGEEGTPDAHPGKLLLWRKMTGLDKAHPVSAKRAALEMMLMGQMARWRANDMDPIDRRTPGQKLEDELKDHTEFYAWRQINLARIQRGATGTPSRFEQMMDALDGYDDEDDDEYMDDDEAAVFDGTVGRDDASMS